ncbi:MAG: hypothetical protein ABI698_09635 [bacterium]
MKVREILVGVVLLSVALSTITANPLSLPVDVKIFPRETKRTVEPAAMPLVFEDDVFSSAYYDTLAILRTGNRCSQFFGGTSTVDIFDSLIAKMHKDYFKADIGIRMTGLTENILNVQTNRAYRMFEKVELNGNGPFYRDKYSDSAQPLPGIGTYGPDTREARVLMLLHELGHTIKSDEGKWLLPNDGDDESLSRRNSVKVEKVCGEEISNLGRAAGKTAETAKAGKASHH